MQSSSLLDYAVHARTLTDPFWRLRSVFSFLLSLIWTMDDNGILCSGCQKTVGGWLRSDLMGDVNFQCAVQQWAPMDSYPRSMRDSVETASSMERPGDGDVLLPTRLQQHLCTGKIEFKLIISEWKNISCSTSSQIMCALCDTVLFAIFKLALVDSTVRHGQCPLTIQSRLGRLQANHTAARWSISVVSN